MKILQDQIEEVVKKYEIEVDNFTENQVVEV